MSPKNPSVAPTPLTVDPNDIAEYTGPLFRLHATTGRHPFAWNEYRTFGPLPSMRWDPHPAPLGEHPDHGIMYAAGDPTTAFAEVFQEQRSVAITEARTLTAWMPSRPIRLLDMTGMWLVRRGASASLTGARKSTCRAWANAVHAQLTPRIEGLLVPSTMTARPNVVLFTTSRDSFPAAPRVSRRLTHSSIARIAAGAARDLGWPVR